MNRAKYFDFIESKLSLLVTRLEMRGGLNILDLHLHSENFYPYFLNLLYGWEFVNLNTVQHNVAGIDIVDTKNNIVAQVSATATKQKIESALSKDLSKYKGYSFKFISISKDANALRSNKYRNPYNLTFSPVNDIYDIKSILKYISGMNIGRQKEVYEFLKKELRNEPDPEKVDSNLATIINILSKEDWSQATFCSERVPYEIDAKISYNQLVTARTLIDEYHIYSHRIDNIYSDYDKQGVNKSFSILNGIRGAYLALRADISPDQCFFSIIEKVIQKIRESANYISIPDEELLLCVQIIVVDAFIRCKIFKNPSGNTHAHS
jgi:hypothetical protein